MRKGFALTLGAGLLTMTMAASAAVVTFEFTGPGGHSLRAYGNTSALHAAARAALLVQKAVPESKLLCRKALIRKMPSAMSRKAIWSKAHQPKCSGNSNKTK